MESFDRELFFRTRRRGPVDAPDLKGHRLWFHSTPSRFCRVHDYKFRIEFDVQRHWVPLRSLSAQLGLKRKLQNAAGGQSAQISKITGMIMGRRPVVFWIRRFNSARTFSFTIP